MCSVYGMIFRKKCQKSFLEDKMTKMSEETIHRGPDENEILYFEHAAIGMNRLSIIGPDDRNAMVQKDGQIYSVFNGEITNYKNLNKDFLRNIQCDSEIILPMYRKYNYDFVKKLGGMFSIAIYDNIKNTICLWRDPLGIKPLYYYSNSEYFIFASEIKAIYAAMDSKPEVDYNAIDNILRYGFNSGRGTVFYGIKKVLPGEMVTVYDGNVKSQKYWKLKFNSEYIKQTEIEEKNRVEEFRELINTVMKENSYSDVQGGFFASGGLDSSLTTAIALQNKDSNYKIPISIRFSPNSVDDEKYVKILENHLKQKVEWVNITPEIARNTLEELVGFIDEPLGNPTHVGTYLMSKRAKEIGLKTIITGDGADELFIGYKRQECWMSSKEAKKLYPSLSWIIPKSEIELIYNEDLLQRVNDKEYMPEIISNMQDALLYERGERLPEYHNMRLDRMTMAHGIEAKVPFQDYRIAEYTFKLSIKELMKNTRKGWLKEIARAWLPDDIVYREKSIFPSLPDEWVAGKGIEWAKNILLDPNSKISKYFDKRALEHFIDTHAVCKARYGKELWAIITLELWLQNLINWK